MWITYNVKIVSRMEYRLGYGLIHKGACIEMQTLGLLIVQIKAGMPAVLQI
jgi:hypothetical protein